MLMDADGCCMAKMAKRVIVNQAANNYDFRKLCICAININNRDLKMIWTDEMLSVARNSHE